MRFLLLLTVCFVPWELEVSSISGPWCAPKLFETKIWRLQITHSDQGAEVWESTNRESYDVIGQRLASFQTGTRNGEEYSVYNLYNYPAGVRFTVQNGVCTSSHLSGNITNPCYGQNHRAKAIAYLLGTIGNNLERSTLMNGVIYYEDGVSSLHSSAGFPLFEGKYGVIDGVSTYETSAYLNATEGISDPAVFTPPASCVNVVLQ